MEYVFIVARGTSDLLLRTLAPNLEHTWPPGPYREAAVAVLNGLCGDHLAHTGNPLALPMRLRVFLPPAGREAEVDGSRLSAAPPIPERRRAFADLLELDRRPVDIHPRADAFAEEGFAPGKRLLVLVHGLCMNDRELSLIHI